MNKDNLKEETVVLIADEFLTDGAESVAKYISENSNKETKVRLQLINSDGTDLVQTTEVLAKFDEKTNEIILFNYM